MSSFYSAATGELETNCFYWQTRGGVWESLTCRRNNNSNSGREHWGGWDSTRNDGWMGMVEEERFWPGNTSFPADLEFGCFARDDFTERTWIHRFTHKPGRSFWAGIFDTLPTDITTAGVNLAELSLGPLPPQTHTCTHTQTPTHTNSQYGFHFSLTLFFAFFSFFDPRKLSRLQQLPAAYCGGWSTVIYLMWKKTQFQWEIIRPSNVQNTLHCLEGKGCMLDLFVALVQLNKLCSNL